LINYLFDKLYWVDCHIIWFKVGIPAGVCEALGEDCKKCIQVVIISFALCEVLDETIETFLYLLSI
jgi:hypothetical protein